MRRSIALLIGSVVFVVLAGCTPTATPIRYDGDTGTTTSHAEWRVAAVSTSKGPGIEIRVRHCNTLVVSGGSLEKPQTYHLRPVARVTDAKGKVLFANASPIDEVRPAGSQVVDSSSPTDDLQRIVVPTAGASGAIKVEPTCTTYPGYGMGPGYSWVFTPCTTTTRSCATRTAGSGVFRG